MKCKFHQASCIDVCELWHPEREASFLVLFQALGSLQVSSFPGQLLRGMTPALSSRIRSGSQRGGVRATCPFLRALQVDMDLAPPAKAW